MKEKSIETTLFSYISRAHNRGDAFLCNELKKQGIKGLVYSHISIIVILSIYNQLSMKEISEKISKDKSTVTSLVNKLERLGYVRKKLCKEDKRVVYLVLEDKADEVIDTINEVADMFEDKVKNILKDEEMEFLLRVMDKLVSKF